MDALSVSPLSPVAFSTLSALRPLPAAAVTATPNGKPAGSAAVSVQDLTQSLFQRTLQATTLFPIAEPATGTAGLLQGVTASLLATLNAPQAVTDTTTAQAATISPAVVEAPATTPSTAPPSAPPVAVIGDQPTVQDAFATSLSPDFAAQTALRFGAGVAAQAALTLPTTELGTGMVRDAARVPRLGNLQPHDGEPGPEAFARAQSNLQRVLRTYESTQTIPTTRVSGGVDLLA